MFGINVGNLMGSTGRIFLLSLLIKAVVTVRVTLERGQTGTVARQFLRGQSPVFVCNYEASSPISSIPPQVEWTFSEEEDSDATHYVYQGKVIEGREEKVKFTPPSSNLVVRNLVPADTGFYKCRVTVIGDNPSVADGVYNLTVLVPPHPNITCTFPMGHEINTGRPATFRCEEEVPQAVPAPQYYWYKDNFTLPMNSTGSVHYGNSSFHYSQSDGTLYFEKVTSEDSGHYYCSASNALGIEQCKGMYITTMNAASTIQLSSVTLFCLAGFGMLLL